MVRICRLHVAAVAAALGALLAGLVHGPVRAQDAYPSRSIVFMVPQATGGSQDTLSREIAQRLAEALKQAVVVENRAGANGIVGTEMVAKARPDGYTLLIGGTGTMAINQSLYSKLSYDPVKAFVPVAMFGYSTSVLVVHSSITAKTIGELIEQAKAKPGAFKYASAGVGSSPHLTAEVFREMAGVDILHVPYKGSTPGVVATAAGETDFMFTGITSALAQIRAGRLRPLSISGPRRSPALPDVPTASESGLPGFEADFWVGLFAPAGTPAPVIEKLNAEVNRIISSPALLEKFASSGIEATPTTPAGFDEIWKKDIERWRRTVQRAGVKAE